MTTTETTPEHPFGLWLTERRDDDTLVGDLARDVLADVRTGCLDPAVCSPGGVRLHVLGHAAADSALDALDAAQDEWEATL